VEPPVHRTTRIRSTAVSGSIPCEYLTIADWASEEAFNTFVAHHRDHYDALNVGLHALTASETLMGRGITARRDDHRRVDPQIQLKPRTPTMQFVAILFAATAVAWFLGRRTGGWRDHARQGLAAAMIVAGLTHFATVEPFVEHLPEWIPAREALVYLTGAVEVALGIALMRSTRHRATVGRVMAAYLIAVFPANIYVAVADIDVSGQPGGLHAWLRLPLQVLFVAWALVSTTHTPAHPHRSIVESTPEPTPTVAS
jgi:uncharacterized membrane protein